MNWLSWLGIVFGGIVFVVFALLVIFVSLAGSGLRDKAKEKKGLQTEKPLPPATST